MSSNRSDHWQTYEWEGPNGGGRMWSLPMKSAEQAQAHCAEMERHGYELSDVDCPISCPSTDHDHDPIFAEWRRMAMTRSLNWTYELVRVTGGTVWHIDGEFGTAYCGQSVHVREGLKVVTGKDIDRQAYIGGKWCTRCCKKWSAS